MAYPIESPQAASSASTIGSKVVYTVITGAYDPLRPAIEAEGWDFLAFIGADDAPETQPNGWRIVPFDAEGLSNPRAARRVRMLAHLFVGGYDYSLYLDGSQALYTHPSFICDCAQWPDFATLRHPRRDCVYQELEAICEQHKATAMNAAAEAARYRSMGVPEHIGLYETRVLLRRHNQASVIALDEAWWQAYMKAETARDQPALAVVLWSRHEEIAALSDAECSRHVHRYVHAGEAQ